MDEDYGTKRYINHFKEHWEQFLLPHKEQWNKKYPNIKLKYFISEATNECSVFGTKINHFLFFKQFGSNYFNILNSRNILNINIDTTRLDYDLQEDFSKKIIKIEKSPTKYSDQDKKVLKDLFSKHYFDKDLNFLLNDNDYNLILDLLSIDKILIPELSYSSDDYLRINNNHKEDYIKIKTKENPEVPIELYQISSSRDVSNNAKFLDKKPFIKLSNGKYMIDSLLTINYLDRIVSNLIYNSDIESFNKVHAPAFEVHILDFIKKIFPTAKFYHSYNYRDCINGKMENIELDLIVNIDNHTLLVCEIKSGKIVFNSPSVDKNYIKPQEKKLKNFRNLLNNSETLVIKKTKDTTTKFEEEFVINKNNFQKIIPILITQDSLGMMPLKEKYDCLAYSIDDLIIFRDILQTSIQWVDFFSEHLLFNERYKKITFIGDVIDILEYYLLNQLHNHDYQEGIKYTLNTDNNKEVTEYMFSLLCNEAISPPKMDLQKNINFLIEALDKLKPKNYMTLGNDLFLGIQYFNEQKKFLNNTFDVFYKKGFSEAGFGLGKENKTQIIHKLYFINSLLKEKPELMPNNFQEMRLETNRQYLKEKMKQLNFSSSDTILFYETIIYMDNKKNVNHISINEIDINNLI